jgi:regulation of enolase protein 1 (concanavalin A-like superfamily)
MHLAKRWRALAGASLAYFLGTAWAAAAAPVVTDVTPPPDGFYGENFVQHEHWMSIRVQFSSTVFVTGQPTLELRVGSIDRQSLPPAFISGAGQTSLSFLYTPRAGNTPSESDNGPLTITGPIFLNGGTIKNANGEDAVLTFSSVEAPGVIIDMVEPPLPVIQSVTPTSPTSAQSFTISGTTEPLSRIIANDPYARVTVDPNGNWSATFDARSPGTYILRFYAMDQAGNPWYPGTPPTVAVSVTVQAAPGAAWESRDIGAVSSAGSSTATASGVEVVGSGADIWDAADEFHFRYQQATGDGIFIARVTSMQFTDDWAKAGIMIRESLAPDARNIFMFTTPESNTAFQYRRIPGSSTELAGINWWSGLPVWLKIVRKGGVFMGYRSSDGATWTEAGSLSTSGAPPPPTMYVGLAVTSHNDGTLCRTVFDQVSIITTSSGNGPSGPPVITSATTASATIGTPFQYIIQATNSPTHFEAYQLPVGLLINKDTGVISGTPSVETGEGPHAVTIFAQNDLGGGSATLTINVSQSSDTGWQTRDIGAVSAAGSSSEAGGVTTVRGSGADIWDTADEFYFRYKAISGDGEFVAYVSFLQNTHAWAKAGVMIRESLAPEARNVFMLVTPESNTGFQYRGATADETALTGINWWSGFPVWLKLVRSGGVFTGYWSSDGTAWTQAGSVTLSGAPATMYFGLAVTSHNDGVLAEAAFSNMRTPSATTPAEPPATWDFRDIGPVGVAGSNSSSGNTITLNASGADIWGSFDAFRFVYKPMQGDCTVEAQVSSITQTNAWAKAGVMIRESLDQGARNAFAYVTPDTLVASQIRAATNDSTQLTSSGWRTVPYWVRLVRSGTRITAFSSSDGSTWNQIAAYELTLPTSVYVGFALTSHENSQLGTAVFTNPSVR